MIFVHYISCPKGPHQNILNTCVCFRFHALLSILHFYLGVLFQCHCVVYVSTAVNLSQLFFLILTLFTITSSLVLKINIHATYKLLIIELVIYRYIRMLYQFNISPQLTVILVM